ncbi:MAG: hypothetical protein U0841_25225 [Chloroflexia bacterium]
MNPTVPLAPGRRYGRAGSAGLSNGSGVSSPNRSRNICRVSSEGTSRRCATSNTPSSGMISM